MNYAQLPPLNSLKAFDAVVRHGSISEAARVLFVSQSAVSRHIVKLEDFLNSKLLYRSKHGVTTTKEGQDFFDQISGTFSQILNATTNVRAMQSGVNLVKISSLSSFALKWLVPRISKFQKSHPEIVLDISIADELPDFENDQKDCAIISRPRYAFDKTTKELFEEELIVVASPSIINSQKTDRIKALQSLPLIHTTTRPELWQSWNEEFDLFESTKSLVGLSFQDFYISIAACVAGSGVALVPNFLVTKEIQSGTLIKLFDESLKSEKFYGLMISPNKEKNEAVIALRDWLIDETINEKLN